jgi:hypothetical protein
MQLVRRFRLPALFCALAVLLCELVSRPSVNMGVCDDWPYILIAQKLAATGHIVYSGWATPILGWQLYLGAAFIKLFGFSLTTVRMSTLLVAMALAFLLQRTLVRAGISERNATIGTLALVLSPLYLMLSVTFMTDIQGLFAIILCLYGCLRALQASTSRATIGWLCFAVVTNAICGSSRQTAWLGILVMVPSTLWLLRAQRRVLLAGAAATFAGALFVFGCMHWFQHQPYTQPEPLLVSNFPMAHGVLQMVFDELTNFFLDIPFLLLPIAALFFPEIRKSSPRVIAALFVGYILLAVHPHHLHHVFLLEPTLIDWVSAKGIFETVPQGTTPIFLHTGVRILLTVASFGGLLGLIASLIRSRRTPLAMNSSARVSWKQLGVLFAPYTIVYTLLFIPRAATVGIATRIGILDRYTLGLLALALLCLVRYYQERIQPRLPLASILMVGIMAIYAIAVTHNMFALDRARVAIAAELRAAGVPDTSVDNGWEYNMGVELQHAAFINNPRIAVPANAYVPTPPLPSGTCPMFWYDKTPHIKPLYGISFNPNACYGSAPFSPVSYSRWLASKPGTLYVVNYTAPSQH